MSVPLPSSNLEGHCSAIDNDTLYVLSPGSFQSLPLDKKAQWSTERMGQSVNGPACVAVASNGNESSSALYVIGGQSGNQSFSGLQRYFFGNKSWETLTPLDNNMQQRTNHSATYLNDSQSILVYAGSQYDEDRAISSQTFLISTVSPYNIQSYTSSAPPTNQPILQPWNSSHAVMVGGTEINTDVWTFGPDDGWQRLPTNLSAPLESNTKAVLIDCDDGGKVLDVYNMSTSPNTVTGVVLLDTNGQPAATGQTVGGKSSSSSSSRKRKRDLTLGDWPSYNSSNAPTVSRTDCSITQNSNGLVVIAGGSSIAPVVIFNQADNAWVDAGNFFDDKGQKPLLPSIATSSIASPSRTATAAPTSSTTASGTSATTPHEHTLTVLGITLGVLFGIAAIFILILLFLRWRKMQRQTEQEQREKDGENRMSFADRGASFMKEAEGSVHNLAPPKQNRYDTARDSNSSLAIIAGKFGSKRNTPTLAPKASFESTARLVKDRNGNMSPDEPVEMTNIGDRAPPPNHSLLTVPGAAAYSSSLDRDARAERKRSSGWSKYFATSAPTGPDGLSHIPSVYVKPNSQNGQSEYSNDSSSSQALRKPPQAFVPPLDIPPAPVNVDGQRLSHVTMGSPSFNDSREDLALRGSRAEVVDGQKGLIVDPQPRRKSLSNSVSSYGNRSTLSSNLTSEFYHESGHMPWTPTSNNFKDLLDSRPPSSQYTTNSVDMSSRVPSRGKSAGFFPGAGTSYRPSTRGKDKPNGGHASDWSAISNPKVVSVQHAEDRDSNITVFPSSDPHHYSDVPKRDSETTAAHPAPRTRKPITSDMSWLDLDLNKDQNRS